jgi:carbon-monoxide dehydrogenase large subunit
MNTAGFQRREDLRLCTGAGRYVSDFVTGATCYAGFVRTDVASGVLTALDLKVVRTMPGVLAAYSARDLSQDGLGDIEHEPLPREDGGVPGVFPQPVLCRDRISHLGEPLALIVADSRQSLADAIEAAVPEITDAAPLSGRAFLRHFGDRDAARAAMDAATHRTQVALDVPRMTAFPLEPRGAIATPDGDGGLIYRASTQNPFALRAQLAEYLGLSPDQIRAVAGDVGGSFGLKGFMAREDAALAWAAIKLGREIAWLPSRSEAMLADAQGRGVNGALEVGLDDNLRIQAVLGKFIIDCGAYPGRRAYGLMNNVGGICGVYAIPAIGVEIEGRLSARPPLAPFRGNGRPEATHAIERALDAAARDLGIDPIELRRINLITPDQMPVTTGLGKSYDCGDFTAVMQAALTLNGDPAARRAKAVAQGRLFGLGLANCIESAAGPKPDFARVTVLSDGHIRIAPGVMSVGQGHETVLSAFTAEHLQIAPAQISYVNGDTDALSNGRGSGGSSGLTVAGSALLRALENLIVEGRALAAQQFGCDVAAVAFRDGGFHRQDGNETVTLGQMAAEKGGQWSVEGTFTPDAAVFPNGTHLCEVEIDPETGQVAVTRYAAVEDVGRVLNPVLVEGQLHGGIAHGLSQGLGEVMSFDETGQLLTGSLMDYRVVRAADMPPILLGSAPVPTSRNPLGVKGVGEAGTVGAVAAFASAVSDALAAAGVRDFDLPATSARVWDALNKAQTG